MSVWDAPNQQVVRADQSAPWDEGAGGIPGPSAEELAERQQAAPAAEEPEEQAEEEPDELESMTKDELLQQAQAMGVTPANQGMTKAELIEAIRAA